MAAGDESAYRRFYEAYFDRLSRYLFVLTAGDEHAKQEALQRTLDRVVRHIQVFDDESVFWSWLTVLARSAHGDERRKRRRYLAFLDRFTRQTEIVHTTAPISDGEDQLRDLLAEGLAMLPTDDRALLDAKYTERRSVREIAEHLGTTEKAVESRLSRVRLKLKETISAALKHENRT